MNRGTSEVLIWDLSIRVFDRANPILPGTLLFGHYLESYFEKRGETLITHKWTQQIWILLTESFLYVVSDLSYVALLICWQIIFVCVYRESDPAALKYGKQLRHLYLYFTTSAQIKIINFKNHCQKGNVPNFISPWRWENSVKSLRNQNPGTLNLLDKLDSTLFCPI